MADYRIVKKTNGLGKVRWVVQRYYSYTGAWEDRSEMMWRLSSARRAMKKLERRQQADTWSTEEVD